MKPNTSLLILAALACSACNGTNAEAGAPPNIVLIISDDHGWTDYGFMGSAVARTPNLDRLASTSKVFTRGYLPAPVCRPSLATLATGLYPHEHGITGNDPPGAGTRHMRDPANRATMERVFARSPNVAELLARSGYQSHQSGKWWEGSPLDHGFSGAMTHGDVTRRGRHGDDGLVIGREGMEPVFEFIRGLQAGEGSPSPFFLWYAPFMPHTPHDPPERLLEGYSQPGRHERVARYFAMVEWFDETVGELVQFLEESGLARNTAVLYVADNGWIPETSREAQSRSRAKMSPYDMGVRTPVMVHWPGHVEPGRDDSTLVSSVDIVPTILGIADVGGPRSLPGIDLRDPVALSARKSVFGATFAHTAVDVDDPAANLKYRSIVRQDGWKLILPYTPNRDVTLMIRGTIADWMRFEPELYDLGADPHETRDLSEERPELVAELQAEIQRWWPVPEGGQ